MPYGKYKNYKPTMDRKNRDPPVMNVKFGDYTIYLLKDRKTEYYKIVLNDLKRGLSLVVKLDMMSEADLVTLGEAFARMIQHAIPMAARDDTTVALHPDSDTPLALARSLTVPAVLVIYDNPEE